MRVNRHSTFYSVLLNGVGHWQMEGWGGGGGGGTLLFL